MDTRLSSRNRRPILRPMQRALPHILVDRRGTLLVLCCLFLLMALIAFGQALWQGFAPVDDDLLVTHNLAAYGPTIDHLRRAFTTFDPELYIPLTFVSYQIDYLIGGLTPFVFHLTNILLHTGNGLLVAWLLFLLTKRKTLSMIAALLFVVHPLNTETVVWIAARKDLLSTFFALLSIIAYIRHREGTRQVYALSVVFLLLALLSKVSTAIVPALLLLYDVLWERRRWSTRLLLEKAPHLLLSGFFVAVAVMGKERILSNHNPWETILMAGKSTAFYLQKLLIPIGLGVFHPYRGEISLLLPGFFIPMAVAVALVTCAIVCAKKYPWVTFGIAFFLITIAPTFINFHKGGEIYFASDRYPYMGMAGMLVLLVKGVDMVMRRIRGPWSHERPWMIGGAAVIALFCILSFVQTRIWNSAETLFSRTLALYPQSIAARAALAGMARRTGHEERAIKILREGLQSGESLRLRLELGNVYAKVGRVDDAVEQFSRAAALEPENPEPVFSLGVLDEHFGKIDEAMAKYRRAVELDPSYVAARNRVARLLLEQQKYAEAETELRAALRWNPNAEGVLYNLSLALDGQGRRAEALPYLEDAHALLPDSREIAVALQEHVREQQP